MTKRPPDCEHQGFSCTDLGNGQLQARIHSIGVRHPLMPALLQALKDLQQLSQRRFDRWLLRSMTELAELRLPPCTFVVSRWCSVDVPEFYEQRRTNQHVSYYLELPPVPLWKGCGLEALDERVSPDIRERWASLNE
ncbi:hypothetical protein [Roseateles puraquae]|uniref:hypothetical protein n=1 Tax=Roseateles puraquae TaxID=431059 RepID=UPI0031D33C6A